MSIFGGIIYAISFQIFAASSKLFLGNVTGVAQIIYDLLNSFFKSNSDYTGLILLLINVPLFLLSYKDINKTFFFKSLLTTVAITITLQMVPAIHIEGVNDLLTLSVIGGLLCGFGAGISLKYGGSGGGTDIVGVYMSLKYKGFSVGKITLMISAIVYIYAFFTRDLSTLIYSIIFTIVMSLVIDRMHYQNQKAKVIVVSKNKDMKNLFINEIGRGGTYWEAKGAYTDEDTYIFLSVCSKYELIRLKRRAREIDEHAFMIEDFNVDVQGNYENHLF